jgi:hypothetical protein
MVGTPGFGRRTGAGRVIRVSSVLSAIGPSGTVPVIPGTIAEYEQRRCAICGARYPGFGFGPPLTRPGIVLWACGPHREKLDKQIRPETLPTVAEPPTF